MTFEDAHNAIRKHFKEQVADPNSYVVRYDNQPGETPDSGKWINLVIDDGNAFQGSFGATRRFRNPGTLVVQIFIEAATGDKDALEMADVVMTVFRGVTVTENGTVVHFRTPTVSRGGRDGRWWRVHVFCPYYFDIIS